MGGKGEDYLQRVTRELPEMLVKSCILREIWVTLVFTFAKDPLCILRI